MYIQSFSVGPTCVSVSKVEQSSSFSVNKQSSTDVLLASQSIKYEKRRDGEGTKIRLDGEVCVLNLREQRNLHSARTASSQMGHVTRN